MKVKKIIILIIIIISMFFAGCYDRIEIEQRAIVGAIALDIVEEYEETYNADLNIVKYVNTQSSMNENKKGPLISFFGLLNPVKIQTGEKAFTVVKVESANLPDSLEKLSQRISRNPFLAQTRMLYLSERIIKNEKVFKETLDRLDKSPKINETANVVVIKGNINNLAKVDPKLESTIAAYISGILENSKTASDIYVLPIYKLLAIIRNNDGACAVPVLEIKPTSEGEDLVINKLVLIKDYKFLTYLDTKYVKFFKIMNNDFKKGRVLVNYENNIIPYYIYSVNKKIYLDEDEKNLKYKVKIELEGDVEELEFEKEVFDEKVIKKMSKTIEESIKQEFEESTKYFQDTIGYDYLGFNDYTHKYHNKIYQKYKDNWDETFKKVQIEYDVKVYIRRIGISKR
ncbi:MAG: Ger(x)C family spore germination protein [Caloramator sp.]|nr:Ger(x)C family spore germination protein [Caloramator sp.]